MKGVVKWHDEGAKLKLQHVKPRAVEGTLVTDRNQDSLRHRESPLPAGSCLVMLFVFLTGLAASLNFRPYTLGLRKVYINCK